MKWTLGTTAQREGAGVSFGGGMDHRENGCSDMRQRIMSHWC